jgi:hypothetical protein
VLITHPQASRVAGPGFASLAVFAVLAGLGCNPNPNELLSFGPASGAGGQASGGTVATGGGGADAGSPPGAGGSSNGGAPGTGGGNLPPFGFGGMPSGAGGSPAGRGGMPGGTGGSPDAASSCTTCIQQRCMATLGACAQVAPCVGLADCIDPCTTSACTDTCASQFPAGLAPFNALVACVNDSCRASCAAGPGPGGAGGGAAADPCAAVPEGGECLSPSSLRHCTVPTGSGQPAVETLTCAAYEECKAGAGGARCATKQGACIEGKVECVSATELRACLNGAWMHEPCATACRSTALGDFCAEGEASALYTGKVLYEARGPNANYTDWDPAPTSLPARDLAIFSLRGDKLLDATYTASDGAFAVHVPAALQAGDLVVVLPLHIDATTGGLAFAVGQPDVPGGEQRVDSAPGPSPTIWSWGIDPQARPSGSPLTIHEGEGGGAVRVFEYLNLAYGTAAAAYGKGGKTLIAWLRLGTAWDCGSCFADLPTELAGLKFQSQIWFPATAQDMSYWADPVTAHELGHWVMSSYGQLPNEGGPHCLGVPTLPGQAWAEGWATGFSSIVRAQSLYYDKQQGTMFWIDLARRRYGNHMFELPAPAGGLLQNVDENEIGAMVMELAAQPAIGSARLFAALASPRLTQSPFARGYTRHTWSVAAGGCTRTGLVNTNRSAPMFADFLDALVCAGAPAGAIDAVTAPMAVYPYPSQMPLCR